MVSGTSEQLGMRPKCDPTIHTALPIRWVRFHWLGYFGQLAPETFGLWVTDAVMGFEIHHGAGNTPCRHEWGCNPCMADGSRSLMLQSSDTLRWRV